MRLGKELAEQAGELVARRLGLRIPEDRQDELLGALGEGIRSAGKSASAYLAELAARPDDDPEWTRLIGRLTVGETYFWRDRACVEALERHVLPALISARRSRRVLRLWSAACSTGEEPYSLAILLDRLLPDRAAWDLTILATDLNPRALERARQGLFDPRSLRDVPAAIRERYFRPRGSKAFELDPEIRKLVRFEAANLAADLPAAVANTPMDLVLCRNTLMYLTPEAMRKAVARLRDALAEDGWLIVAPAEASAEAFRPLVPVNFPGAIFFRRGEKGGGEETAASAWAQAAPASRRRRTGAPSGVAPSPEPAKPSPAVPAAPWARARALADRGSLDEALRLCQAALAADRLDAEGYQLLAAIQQERGEPAAAIEALRRALYLEPDSPEAHAALGSLLVTRGERRDGLRHLQTAARMHDERGETR